MLCVWMCMFVCVYSVFLIPFTDFFLFSLIALLPMDAQLNRHMQVISYLVFLSLPVSPLFEYFIFVAILDLSSF